MSTYFFIFIISFIFSFCYSNAKNKSSIFCFFILLFLSLFIPAAFRYNIGTDYKNYVADLELAINGHYKQKWEIGWTPIIWVLQFFHLDIQFFFIISSFLTLFFIFKSIDRKNSFICIPVFVAIEYLESFSLVRQALGVSILLYATMLFIQSKKIFAYIWVIIAGFFHSSCYLYLIILFLLEWKILFLNRKLCLVIFITSFILLKYFKVASILLTKTFSNISYIDLYMNSVFNKKVKIGTGLGFLLKEFLIFSPFLFVKKKDCEDYQQISLKHKLGSISLEYQALFILVFSLFSANILATQIHIFNRLSNLFSSVYVFEVLIVSKSRSKYKRILLFGMELIFFIFFVTSVFVEKSSHHGGLGITPYQSILQKY